MQRILLSLLAALGLAGAAPAQVTTGADVGYLFDSEGAYSTARVGYQLRQTLNYTHDLELEVGYTETTEAGGDASLLPVTLNYRFQSDPAVAWGYFAGIGAGIAHTRVHGVSTNGSVILSDDSFAAQAFGGIAYRFNPRAAATLGLRYLWIDDVKLAGASFEVGDDVAISAGLHFRF